MAIEIKQALKATQQLAVTPQLQQAIKLLQLSRLELSDLIQKELTENPVLEEVGEEAQQEETKTEEGTSQQREPAETKEEIEEVGTKDGELKEPTDFDWENYIGIYNAPGLTYTPNRAQPPEDLPTYENTVRQTESLQDHLFWQLHLSHLSEEEKKIATEIIGNINDDGYLQISVEELARKLKKDTESVETVLRKVQNFDPPGVAARSLKECLILQARVLGKEGNLIVKVIEEHLHELEMHKYSTIAKKQNIPVEKVKEIANIIQSMEPKPGRPYSSENIQYITPDVYVYKVGDDYMIMLNEDGLPKLQISNFYRQQIIDKDNLSKKARDYIQEKLKSALWLIKSIHQRQRTLYKVAESIVKFQRDFFDKGINHLKPLVLRDVAEDIDMHESTISRVTTNKYMHTPRGIFELKYFFNSKIANLSGDVIASEAVRNKIKRLIENEDPKKPLSDSEIANILKQHNINIARRTVAKYRENMKIPSSSRRRREF